MFHQNIYQWIPTTSGTSGERNKETKHRHACHWTRGCWQGAKANENKKWPILGKNGTGIYTKNVISYSVTLACFLGWASLWNRSEARTGRPGKIALCKLVTRINSNLTSSKRRRNCSCFFYCRVFPFCIEHVIVWSNLHDVHDVQVTMRPDLKKFEKAIDKNTCMVRAFYGGWWLMNDL